MSPSAGHRTATRPDTAVALTRPRGGRGHKRNELRGDDQATHQFTMGSRDGGVNPPVSRGHFFAGNVVAVRARLAPASSGQVSDWAGTRRAAPAWVANWPRSSGEREN